MEVDFCSSPSTSKTFLPIDALITARLVEMVVFPVPPFTPPTTSFIHSLYGCCIYVVLRMYIQHTTHIHQLCFSCIFNLGKKRWFLFLIHLHEIIHHQQ